MPLAPQRSPERPDAATPSDADRPSFLRVVATVLSAFIGIRKRASAEAAHAQIKPVHIVIAGIIGALMFIAILVTLVRFIIAR